VHWAHPMHAMFEWRSETKGGNKKKERMGEKTKKRIKLN